MSILFTPRLPRFYGKAVLLNSRDSNAVFRFLFPTDLQTLGRELNIDDRGFAQSLLVGLLIENLGRHPEVPEEFQPDLPTPTAAFGFIELQDVINRFVVRADPAWFGDAVKEDLLRTHITEDVRADFSIRFRALWVARWQRGSLLVG
ncbi:MAG: hypothetical protein L6R30_00530 [Thermoanaerobaculia bacterium]|nr:hypothetical protein [Thermoanaerobaculia bacterium]